METPKLSFVCAALKFSFSPSYCSIEKLFPAAFSLPVPPCIFFFVANSSQVMSELLSVSSAADEKQSVALEMKCPMVHSYGVKKAHRCIIFLFQVN